LVQSLALVEAKGATVMGISSSDLVVLLAPARVKTRQRVVRSMWRQLVGMERSISRHRRLVMMATACRVTAALELVS